MKSSISISLIAVLALAGLGWCSQGCGNDKILLTLPDGDTVPWEGSIKVVATIKEQGDSPQDGRKVSFSTTVGSFEPFDSTSVTEPVKTADVFTQGGGATVDLHNFWGEGGETGTVSANYTTINNESISGTATVTMEKGGIPSGSEDHLKAKCDVDNVQAYPEPVDTDMMIRCTLSVKDARSKTVHVAEIETIVDEGKGRCTFKKQEQLSDAGEHVFILTPNCLPADVEPITGEPSHMYMGEIHNPRDGLLTILFCVKGNEGFTDNIIRNEQYDPGEPFSDQPEPWVDVNDNGEWDPGEFFKDTNDDDVWSPADGRWSEDTWIWTTARIMFTGPPHVSADTTRFEPSGINISNGGEQDLSLYLMDENHNPIAVNSDNDVINFTANNAQIDPDDRTQYLVSFMGISFDSDEINILVESFNDHRTYDINLKDYYPGDDIPRTVTLSTEMRWTPAVRCDSYSPTGQSAELDPITGTSN